MATSPLQAGQGGEPENPPAFPHTEPRDPSFSVANPGMSLRDYFAGQALAGAMASDAYNGVNWSVITHACYNAADAMLAERAKGGAA